MKRVALIFVLLASALIPALAQRIETETSGRTRILHLKTALNHLTVIEVAEPVVQVAAGSSSFRVEWRENKVFVQPTSADATTNLFVWTATQRLNYELEPASSVTNMDFAVDQIPIHPAIPVPTIAPPPAPPSITALLLAGKPVRQLTSKERGSKPLKVWISDLYEKDGRLSVRYTICNHSTVPYFIDTPSVYQLDGVHSPQSLYGLTNSQLGDEQAAKLKAKQFTPVTVLDAQIEPTRIASGEEVVGVVTLQMVSSTHPTILRFQFSSSKQLGDEISNDRQSQIDAFLVR